MEWVGTAIAWLIIGGIIIFVGGYFLTMLLEILGVVAGFLLWFISLFTKKPEVESDEIVPRQASIKPRVNADFSSVDAEKESLIGRLVEFDYMDADDNETTRQVYVTSVDKWKLKGNCKLRRAQRTFRFDSMQSLYITDVETGELLWLDN